MSDGTIVEEFWARVETQADRPALRFRDGESWAGLPWGDYGTQVREVGAGLIDRGIEAGDRVAILAGNQPAWHVVDMAILSVGAVSVPVYATNASAQVAHVLADSGARACFVDDSAQLAKVLLHRDDLPDLEWIVAMTSFDGLNRPDLIVDVDRLRAAGRDRLRDEPDVVADRVAAVDANRVATLVYTSGTTGSPKGVMLSHRNIMWTVDSVKSLVGLHQDDRFLSYLPLSHIAERVTSHFGQIEAGGETWFARSLATVPEDLRACRPTVFFAVPRVWQKFRTSILDSIEDAVGPVRRTIEWYLAAGTETASGTDSSRPRRVARGAGRFALDRTVGAMLRRKTGLDQARVIISSAAPIHPDLLRWFGGLGIAIAEVWGQTEDCGPATMNPPDDIRIGTVGRPIPGLEIRTGPDDELLVRGGSVCLGYHGRPDETAALIDSDGWLATGDLGSIDADGYVTITGRKKDLIINAAGKNIAPSEIETRLSMEPLIGQAVVVGDGRKYLVALLTLDADDVAKWAEEEKCFGDMAAVIRDPALLALVEEAVERVNREHAPVEQIKSWRVLPEPLTVEADELTPTMKVRRPAVRNHYADLIEEMYADGQS